MSLSVVPAKRNYVAWITVGIYFCTFIVVSAAWMQFSAFALQEDASKLLREQNGRIEATIRNEADVTAPSSASLDALSQRVVWYNNQIPDGAAPVMSYLINLEGILPDDVKLASLYYDRQGKYLTVSIVSKTEASLLRALNALQDKFESAEVELERQLTLDGASSRHLQYDVRVAE